MTPIEHALELTASIPLEPDPDEARRLLVDELAKPIYQEARPTPFDLLAQAIGDWIASVVDGAGQTGGTLGLVFIVALIAALLVVAFLVFGRPRLERRRRGSTALFGEDDVRTAEQMRAAARAAAGAGDWDTAVIEAFRALARGLDERTLVDVHPGTTATGFVRAAAAVFPEQQGRLIDAARVFDAVRYLGGRADEQAFDALSTLDRDISGLRPVLQDSAAGSAP